MRLSDLAYNSGTYMSYGSFALGSAAYGGSEDLHRDPKAMGAALVWCCAPAIARSRYSLISPAHCLLLDGGQRYYRYICHGQKELSGHSHNENELALLCAAG